MVPFFISVFLFVVPMVLYIIYTRCQRLRPLAAGLAGFWVMPISIVIVLSIFMSEGGYYPTERSKTSGMQGILASVKLAWVEAFVNGKPLEQADIAIPTERVSGLPLHYLRVFQNGTIVLIGGYKGNRNERLLVLLPKLTRDALNWECLGGGRASYFPADCRP